MNLKYLSLLEVLVDWYLKEEVEEEKVLVNLFVNLVVVMVFNLIFIGVKSCWNILEYLVFVRLFVLKYKCDKFYEVFMYKCCVLL